MAARRCRSRTLQTVAKDQQGRPRRLPGAAQENPARLRRPPIALRPTQNGGRWALCMASHPVGVLDITGQNRNDQTVRRVCELMSDMPSV